ncbi:MAG: NDP-hexose 2,3-dehydratase [Bacilli bacterium]|nr:NDP-hexose 2,3-dehydratase [Bacilli bacterium]
MRVEKLGDNKIRIFISYEDLDQRGIDRDEIWQNGGKVQELFWDMMERAYVEVGFEVVGPIAVEAFTMPTEGVVVIVTQVPQLPAPMTSESRELAPVVTSESDKAAGCFTFSFADFEHVISAAKMLDQLILDGVSLYSYKENYYLVFEDAAIVDDRYDDVWSILQEYGSPSSVTTAVLDEYGKKIMEDHAVRHLNQYFGS